MIDKTKEAIEHLTDEEVEMFLHKKWVDPVVAGIDRTLAEVLREIEMRVTVLVHKYSVSYQDIEKKLAEAKEQLSWYVNELTGDELVLKGLKQMN